MKNKENKNSEEVIEEIYDSTIVPPHTVKSGGLMFWLACLIFSLVGGFIGGWAQATYQSQFNLSGNANVNGNLNNKVKDALDLNFLLKDTSSNDKALVELRNQIVGFYKIKSGTGILDTIYLDKDFLGSGAVITSDGWLMTHKSVIKDNNFVVVTADKKIWQPQSTVADNFSGLVLVKIKAQGLAPADFADITELTPTATLLAARYSIQDHGSDLQKNFIQKFAYHDQSSGLSFLMSADKIDHYLKISNTLELNYNGGLLFDDKNEIVGLLFNSGRPEISLAIPAYYLKSAVSDFLANSKTVIRPSLGVTYVSLNETLGLSNDITEGQTAGAVLLGDPSTKNSLAIIKGSAAEKAGLKPGDIILKVNEDDVDESNSLTKLIQEYSPGKEITLTIFRDNKQQEIKVVLGQM